MEDDCFWYKQWQDGTTAWNKDFVEPLLVKHYSKLIGDSAASDRHIDVFVPLCGKTLDMIWLADQGACVVGCELSDLAAQQFFTDNNIKHTTRSEGSFTIYEATEKKIKYLVGDVFKCSTETIGSFDAIWDQNSLVALNIRDRERYVALLKSLLKPEGRMLLTTFEYDQSCYDINKSPHTIPPNIVRPLYEQFGFTVTIIDELDLTDTSFTKLIGGTWANKFAFSIVSSRR